MSATMKRRDFVKSGVLLGTAALAGGLGAQRQPDPKAPRVASPDLAVVTGADRVLAVNKGLEALGGMKRFVKPGSTVGLLINAPAWWTKPGSHTHPDITLAVILAALAAGAKDIQYLIDPLPGYWKRSSLAAQYAKETGAVRPCSKDYVETAVAKNKTLKKASVVKEFLDCDVFVNLPIIKHHVGVGMSGNLKNLMGVNTGASNQFFHAGSGRQGRVRRHPLPGPVRRRPQHPAPARPLRRRRHRVPADQRAGRAGRDPQARQGRPGARPRGRRRLRRAFRQPQGGRRADDHEVGRMGPRPHGRRQAGGRTTDRLIMGTFLFIFRCGPSTPSPGPRARGAASRRPGRP
ncbi:MAG: DUF362 domain-containing protein [Candidatus Moduliflexus flocculans]|nr:DUF362 domain-containing protein [Candidatus Moduliflexus flocculans]